MTKSKKPAKAKPRKPAAFMLPENVAKAPVMHRKRVTHKTLPKLTRDMLVAWSPTMVQVWFTETYKSAMDGSKSALDDIAEIYGLINRRGNMVPMVPMVNVNVGGQMAIASSNGNGFDAFIRELNEAQRMAVRPADAEPAPLLPAVEN